MNYPSVARPFARIAASCLLLLPLAASGAGAEVAGRTALMEAVRRGDSAAWQQLVSTESVKARDAQGNSALHFAALNQDIGAVRALLAAGAEVDARNKAEATALIYGAGSAEVVRALLAAGADVNAVSALMTTPLLAAAAHPESFAAVESLVKAGADVAVLRGQDPAGALGAAVGGGDRRTIDLLLERGADKNPRTLSAALVTAAVHGKMDLVRLLRARGADVNLARGSGHSLNFALYAQQLDVAQFLIEEGASTDVRSTNGHSTPTMVFAAYNQSGDASAVKALVAAGADVNVANDHGMTALAYALRSGPHTPLVEYLRRVGAKAPESSRVKPMPNRAVPATAAERALVAVERMPATLALLQRSSDAFLDNRFVQQQGCTSCHGQDLPPVAYALARDRGLKLDDVSLGKQITAHTSKWITRAERARQMIPPTPGAPISVAYGLFGLRALDYPPDDMTDAMVRWLLRTQKGDGHWDDFTRRPPMEDGAYVSTGWIPLAIRDYAPAGYERAAADSQVRTARWLTEHSPATHNEMAFQVLGLHWSGVSADRIQLFLERVIAAQKPDGGWAQLPGLESDAWATGTALYALHKAGGMPTTHAVYQRGVAFLLRTQFEDGSWWVRSRSWPFQPHFNGQFPHGKDQWISQGATAWAAIALLFTVEPSARVNPHPSTAALMATYAKSSAAQQKKSAPRAERVVAGAETPVNFARDIEPLLKRSCAGCHGGKSPRAGFQVATREALLKGGASGEASISPGYSDDSPLVQYITGKIEDLEMPPLDRRDKYPALTVEEVDLVRTWIDAGAPGAPKSAATPNARGVDGLASSGTN